MTKNAGGRWSAHILLHDSAANILFEVHSVPHIADGMIVMMLANVTEVQVRDILDEHPGERNRAVRR